MNNDDIYTSYLRDINDALLCLEWILDRKTLKYVVNIAQQHIKQFIDKIKLINIENYSLDSFFKQIKGSLSQTQRHLLKNHVLRSNKSTKSVFEHLSDKRNIHSKRCESCGQSKTLRIYCCHCGCAEPNSHTKINLIEFSSLFNRLDKKFINMLPKGQII